MKSLAARAGCSENTFRKWVQPWIRLGVVVAIPRPGDGSGALTTLHILRPSVYWNSFDRKPGQTFENPEPSEGEAKRNSEPKVPTTPQAVVQVQMLFLVIVILYLTRSIVVSHGLPQRKAKVQNPKTRIRNLYSSKLRNIRMRTSSSSGSHSPLIHGRRRVSFWS